MCNIHSLTLTSASSVLDYNRWNYISRIVFSWLGIKDTVAVSKLGLCFHLEFKQQVAHLCVNCPVSCGGEQNLYLLTYLSTPWSNALLEKLTGSQQVKKFPAFYRTRKFNTAFTTARHLSLS
jgi:hypothetical protein